MPNLPTMHDVESHMIAKIGYDAANQSLYVQFHGSAKSGPALWRYDGVSPMEYTQLTSAASLGKHFIANIRGSKTSTRIS